MKADIILEEDVAHAVEVIQADGRFRVSIADGDTTRELDVEFVDVGGATKLRVGGKSYLIEVSQSGGHYAACVDSHRLTGRLVTPEQRLRERLDGSLGTEKNSIEAKMPGKVLDVFVQAGDAVAEGDKIAIVEAMKMENTIRAPRDGVIGEVNVAQGDNIQAGHTIVVLEEQE